jgi:hypothetical protein
LFPGQLAAIIESTKTLKDEKKSYEKELLVAVLAAFSLMVTCYRSSWFLRGDVEAYGSRQK